MTIDRSASVRHMVGFAGQHFSDPAVTEICINEPGVIWTLSDKWTRHNNEVTANELESLSTAVARFASNDISDTRPILSAVLPAGERIHIVRPPACEHHAITIRKPASKVVSIDRYKDQGFFEVQPAAVADDTLDALFQVKDYATFLTEAVATGKSIVVAGSTGSGKTTMLRTLMQSIPADNRVITIEDVPELQTTHANRVPLFYQSTTSKPGSSDVTATELLRSALRMLPSRILVGELRGAETMDFINACASGHSGSMTTLHAGSCELALERLCLMAMQADTAIPFNTVQRLVHSVVDVVVHIADGDNGRHITGLVYQP